jgi:hypothetical protein
METTSTAATPVSVQPQTALYGDTLRSIFEKQLIGTNGSGLWCQALQNGNIWRSSWAFDTLLDCLSTMNDLQPGYQPPKCTDGLSFMDFSLENGLNASSGDWWDDFGWFGIACLRAAESGRVTDEQKRLLLRKAVNAWAYMFGNGWDGSNPLNFGQFSVPYPDAWDKDGIRNNQGAPNVYKYATSYRVPNPATYLPFAPFFQTGGIWNSTLTGTDPKTRQHDRYNPDQSYLSPLQNTVTNAVYALLSLRIFNAITNPAYARYFSDNPVNTTVVYMSWMNQLTWFRNWLFDPLNQFDNIDRKLLMPLDQFSALVRERVSSFANNKWDAAYYKGLAWTGDQGLLIGLLRESEEKVRNSAIPGDFRWLSSYSLLLNGMREQLYSEQDVPTLGVQLRPWIQYSDATGEATFPDFPEGDDADYQTGIAVFYRYLLQLQAKDATLAAPFRDQVFATANAICASDFPAPADDVYYSCEGMVRQIPDSADRQTYNFLTPWVNRIALLCMAIRLSKQ